MELTPSQPEHHHHHQHHQQTEVHRQRGVDQHQLRYTQQEQQQQTQQPYNYTLEFDVPSQLSATEQKLLQERGNPNFNPDHLEATEKRGDIDKPPPNQSATWNSEDLFNDLEDLQTKVHTPQLASAVTKPAELDPRSEISTTTTVDWRFGAIEVFDLAQQQKPSSEKNNNNNNNNIAKTSSAMTSKNPSGLGLVKGVFLGYGVVRLFKSPATAAEEAEDKELYIQSSNATEQTYNDTEPSTTLCVLAVPNYMTPYDLMQYFSDGYADSISHYRLVRSGGSVPSSPNNNSTSPSNENNNRNSNMVLIKFRDFSAATRFYEHFNGRTFNSLEPESCHVVYLQHIRNKTVRSIPALPDDPFVETGPSLSGSTSAPTAAVELPTCPVCLERMDSSVTGLLTIQCQHTFHCQCLTKWRDGSCPVCRYSSSNKHGDGASSNGMTGNGSFAGDAGSANRACAVCQATNNLWICLICGHLGCGRYDQAHAHDHYMATGHCFAMDVGSQRVWDYGADGYVHRLMQNQEDGKLVEIPSPMPPPIRGPGMGIGRTGVSGNSGEYTGAGTGAFGADGYPKVSIGGSSGFKPKADVGEEFAQLLTSQLDSQREYYESLLSTAVERISLLNSTEQRLQDISKEQEKLQQERARLERELDKAHTKTARLQENYEKALHRYMEERAINERTVEKMQRLETEQARCEVELTDLREQVRDLMFFHEAQEQFKDVADEVKEGQVTVGPGPSSSSSSKKKKARKKKKNEVVITTK